MVSESRVGASAHKQDQTTRLAPCHRRVLPQACSFIRLTDALVCLLTLSRLLYLDIPVIVSNYSLGDYGVSYRCSSCRYGPETRCCRQVTRLNGSSELLQTMTGHLDHKHMEEESGVQTEGLLFLRLPHPRTGETPLLLVYTGTFDP